ncbi:hypothetical protein A2U01_0049705, partial [Trifolium medium]|nr:hypothetical protein [Trifolium medium]
MDNTSNNDKDHYSIKPPVFDGEKFDYWKDRIKSFFLGYDAGLWDMVTVGYTHPVDKDGVKLERNNIDEQQKKDSKNHYK